MPVTRHVPTQPSTSHEHARTHPVPPSYAPQGAFQHEYACRSTSGTPPSSNPADTLRYILFGLSGTILSAHLVTRLFNLFVETFYRDRPSRQVIERDEA
ncbi:hypothetical protein M405DRAFT_810104, partial [Rhizopogon salebrosus TDB-379]